MEAWTAAYKTGGLLYWPVCFAKDRKEASEKLDKMAKTGYGGKYRRYGGPFPEKNYTTNK